MLGFIVSLLKSALVEKEVGPLGVGCRMMKMKTTKTEEQSKSAGIEFDEVVKALLSTRAGEGVLHASHGSHESQEPQEEKVPPKRNNKRKVSRPRCLGESCEKIPCFNFPGVTGGTYCAKHKQENMVNVVNKSCEDDSCPKIPRFNYKGVRGGRYCAKHKLGEMVDVKHRTTCETVVCQKQPVFNYPDQPKRRFCATHKLDGMIDVVRDYLLHRKPCSSSIMLYNNK